MGPDQPPRCAHCGRAVPPVGLILLMQSESADGELRFCSEECFQRWADRQIETIRDHHPEISDP
jgi:hypothetical protein